MKLLLNWVIIQLISYILLFEAETGFLLQIEILKKKIISKLNLHDSGSFYVTKK